MPSQMAKEWRKATRMRAAEHAAQSQKSEGHNNGTVSPQPAVDGEQQTGEEKMQMQKTASRHGKQSEHQELYTPVKITAQDGSDRPFTNIVDQIQTHQPSNTSFRRTLPGSQAMVDSFGTAYSTLTKGLSEWQIKKACDKAWVEVMNEMQVIPDQQYDSSVLAEFHRNVQKKAARIMESKRRRCARTNRQPSVNNTTQKLNIQV